jgi:membrane-bound lytic murein transglycosylase A
MRLAHLSLLVLFSAACVTPGKNAPPRKKAAAIHRVAPTAWPQLSDELSPESYDKAAAQSIAYLRSLPEKTLPLGKIEVGPQHLIATIEELGRTLREAQSPEQLQQLLQARFDLYRIGKEAHFSSYYMPTLPASRIRTAEYKYPLYKKPKDLIEVDLGAFNKKQAGKTLVARIANGKVVPYFNRQDIDVRDSLKGRGLEVAWLKDGFDRLNIHIQGSGILRYADGSEELAGYAATSGHKYKSVGLTVVGAGAMTRKEITAQTLKKYLQDHPEGEAWLISQNPRYTFFKVRPLPAGGEPSGKIDRPLTAGRSIAIDPTTVPLGAVAFIQFRMAQANDNGALLMRHSTQRFVHAQDVGGAIKGAGRVDLYVGHGPQAHATAHKVWDKGEMYVLLKKVPARNL